MTTIVVVGRHLLQEKCTHVIVYFVQYMYILYMILNKCNKSKVQNQYICIYQVI